MTVRTSITRPCLATLFLCIFGVGMPVGAFEVAPHRAVYDLSYAGANGRSSVVDVSGRMEFEWEDSCDGWSVTQRMAMSLAYEAGEALDLGWNVVTWESKDGLRYRFFVRILENGELKEEFRGEARLEGPGKAGVAEYSLPQRRTLTLPAGTLFPTAHTMELLKRIEAGEMFFWATIFDGSDESGLSDISAIVTDPMATEAGATGPLPLLRGSPYSRVNLAFFARDTESAEPENEQQLRLHQNGVVETISFDFGDFNVEGKLQELKALSSPC